MLEVLAADSLEGRGTGTPGSLKAARFIASRMQAFGLSPAGDSGFYQRVPLQRDTLAGSGGASLRLGKSGDATTNLIPAFNVVAILPGSDSALRSQAILVDAHYDHLGIGQLVAGDSIYNGADDDGSGVVAVLEIARVLAKGPRPRRTVIFLTTTGEEVGLLGTRWYIQHPVVPLKQTAANLEIEMIGRPDSLAGGAGKAWLTGYDRSTMGDQLKAAGIPIVADPRPDQQFFLRSDNIAFARMGIPAHTLSSFGLHGDYHQPSDDVSRIDWNHLDQVIEAATRAVRLLADGSIPVWKAGGQPGRTGE
jgi:Zn-dependent M28 family amino/carboxypeptidase